MAVVRDELTMKQETVRTRNGRILTTAEPYPSESAWRCTLHTSDEPDLILFYVDKPVLVRNRKLTFFGVGQVTMTVYTEDMLTPELRPQNIVDCFPLNGLNKEESYAFVARGGKAAVVDDLYYDRAVVNADHSMDNLTSTLVLAPGTYYVLLEASSQSNVMFTLEWEDIR